MKGGKGRGDRRSKARREGRFKREEVNKKEGDMDDSGRGRRSKRRKRKVCRQRLGSLQNRNKSPNRRGLQAMNKNKGVGLGDR